MYTKRINQYNIPKKKIAWLNTHNPGRSTTDLYFMDKIIIGRSIVQST